MTHDAIAENAQSGRKTIKDFDWKVGARIAAIVAVIGASYAYLGSRYSIGLDTQEYRCLDEWIFVIDTWNVPDARDVDRNQYLAVRLTPDQTPENALWPPGMVMVKRAVATDEGDIVSISRDGISFSHGDEHWQHGTGLEAAESVGNSIEQFERELTLREGEVFMMGDNPMSYDGRYYGPISEDQIVGTVIWAF